MTVSALTRCVGTLVVAAAACASLACSSGSDANKPGGTGGGAGSGTGGTGGSSAAGGTGGGSTGGTGGGTGGSGGSSGAGASGGSSGSAGAPFDESWTFDTDLDQWDLDNGEPAAIDTGSTADWDGTNGDPALGSVAIVIPFDDAGQKITFAHLLAAPTDLSGKTLSIKVKLDSGLSSDPTNPGGANLYVKSDGFIYGGAAWTNLDAGNGWTALTLDVSDPDGFIDTSGTKQYDPTMAVEIGVEIKTGDAGTMYESATLHVDTAGYR